MKQWDRRRVKPQPKFGQRRGRTLEERLFVDHQERPKDVVVAGLGLVEIQRAGGES